MESPTWQGLLYFVTIFFAIMGLWLDKVFYDARFVVCEDDLYHRIFEWARLAVLATAILHIRTVDIMQNSSHYFDMFCFTLMVLVGNVLTWIKYLEVYFRGIGQPVIRSEALRWIKVTAPFVGLLLVATILSGLEFYQSSDDDDKTEVSYYASNNNNTTGYYLNAGDAEKHPDGDDDGHRKLAGTSDASSYSTVAESYDIPIYLILVGYILRWLYILVNILFCLPTDGSHKDLYVIPVQQKL